MNPDLLKQVKQECKYNQEYQRKSEEYQRSYYKNNYSNHNNHSSYGLSNDSNYTDNDRAMLKQFYKVLTKKYHPDANPGIDTADQMKLLNQLKQDWGI